MLVIGSVWPEPQSSAAGAHLLQVLRPFLEEGWEVHCASTAAESEFAVNLEALGIQSHTVRVNDPAFDALLTELSPDIVLFDRFFVEEQFGWRIEEACPNALRILNSEDLHSLREARRVVRSSDSGAKQTALSFSSSSSSSSFLSDAAVPTEPHTQSKVARREIASILRSDLTLIISEEEMRILHRDFKVDPDLLHYCPFMLDKAETKSWPSFDARRGFVCIGNYRHAPNWDAIEWMAEEIWPRIRARLPQANLRIAGAYATPAQLSLHDPKQGLLVEGRIENADVAFRQARVCLAPLRFGAGLKGKLFDAMRNGTPSVTTPIGAEGIGGGLPFGGSIEDSGEGLAEAAVRLHEDALEWSRAQALGQTILTTRFDRVKHETALMEAVHRAREHLQARRDQNFVGAMLRDHHHKSTRYLSLWIEAKNKLAEQEVLPASQKAEEDPSGIQSALPPRKNLLNSKWSAIRPQNKEKHFLVTRVSGMSRRGTGPPRVELEAVLSKRRFEIPLDELGNADLWKQGWT